MPYIQLNDTRHPLRVGAMRVGAAPDAELRLPGAADPVAAAVVEVGADQSASIRRAHESAVVLVNGVRLGVHPAPLIHGDKIGLGGHALLFGDDKKSGSTQYVPSMGAHHASGSAGAPGTVANNGAGPRTGLATGATGGLLRSLVDGREYPVAEAGLVIGRDAGCDVVVPSGEVSRRHAAIMPTGAGYQLRDTSTNGVWVNGTRIEGVATLGRGDVVRIGGEEFRFYADAGEPAGVPAGAPNAAAAATPSAAAPRASAPLVAPEIDNDVRTGAISVHLLRPLSYPLYRLAATLGERFVRFTINATVGSIIALAFVGPIPFTAAGLAMFVVALPLAFVLDFMAYLVIGLLAFWLENTSGLVLIYSRVTLIFGGVLLPLELFPDAVQPLLHMLPFSSVVYGPARTFVAPDPEFLVGLLVRQAVGVAVFAVLAAAVYTVAVRRIHAHGG